MQTAMRRAQQPSTLSEQSNTTDIAAGALDLMEQYGCTVTVRRAHGIYLHDQPTEFCWRVLSGCARTVRMMHDGRRQIGEFLWPGDLLGFNDLETYYADAEAVTDVTLRRYPRRLVEATAERHAALALLLRTMALVHLRCAQKQNLLLGRKTAIEKIASFLLDVDRRSTTSGSRLVALPMNRTDIADYLGLSIETVCRNLAHLQRDGAVVILRSGIELCDRVALLDVACEAPQ